MGENVHTRFENGALTVCIGRLLGAAERKRLQPLIEILAAAVAGRDPIPSQWDRDQWESARLDVGTWLADLFDKAYPKPPGRRRVSAAEALTIYWNSDAGRERVYWNGTHMGRRAETDKVWPLEGVYEVEDMEVSSD
jgi:hypothetical protein